jgi:hypothetical protein
MHLKLPHTGTREKVYQQCNKTERVRATAHYQPKKECTAIAVAL